jgi:hypothetical protein
MRQAMPLALSRALWGRPAVLQGLQRADARRQRSLLEATATDPISRTSPTLLFNQPTWVITTGSLML